LVQVEKKKKTKSNARLKLMDKKIFSNRSKQAEPKAGEKTDKKGGKGQSVRWKA